MKCFSMVLIMQEYSHSLKVRPIVMIINRGGDDHGLPGTDCFSLSPTAGLATIPAEEQPYGEDSLYASGRGAG